MDMKMRRRMDMKMRRSIAALLAVLFALVKVALSGCGASSVQTTAGLTKIVFANPTSSQNPLFMNIVVGKELGYFKEEGIDVEFQYLGSNAAVAAALDSGKAQFGITNPFFQISQAARGNRLSYTNFYQYTYLPKWSVVVGPDSTISSVTELKGKQLGLVGLNSEDQSISDQWLTKAGLTRDDVKYKVIGQGAPMGAALDSGQIDAALVWDSTLGFFDVAGIKYKKLPPPDGLPVAGGFSISAAKKYLGGGHDKIVVGVGRAVAKATVYALENPVAAALAYNKLYPESVAAGTDPKKAAADTATLVSHRAKAWAVAEGLKWGETRPEEWKNMFALAGTMPDVPSTDKLTPEDFNNETFIDRINKFDAKVIRAAADKAGT